ncbi:MAG TPA: diguanylate cyclase, partial [Desulfobacteria bacterium]|nr:diguanylate cyclase [Desulfobacteria bacterium]
SAERLRSIVSENVTEYGKHEIRITASFGVVGYKPSSKARNISYEAIINQADEALYQAKNEGRNRVKGRLFNA